MLPMRAHGLSSFVLCLLLAIVLGACKQRSNVKAEPSTPAELVRVEGYGVSIALVPPFKGGRLPAEARMVPDQIVFAHPQGERIRNLIVLPRPGSSGRIRLVPKGPMFAYVVGDEGTLVGLGADMPNADGVAQVNEGPVDAGWRVRVGERSVPWPEGVAIESALPAPGYVFAPTSK